MKEKVDNKETTWQSLYETYDLFGKDADVFKENNEKVKSENGTRNSGSNSLLKMLEGVNLDKINENLEGMKKILGVLGEFTKKENNTSSSSRRNSSRTVRRYDD